MSSRIPIAALRRQKQDVGGVTIGSEQLNNRRIDTILQQACVSGTLRIANRNLTSLPKEIFFLQEMDYDSKRWWEEQQLTVLDVSHNLLERIEVPTTGTTTAPQRPTVGRRTASDEPESNQAHPLQAFQRLRLIVASYNKLVAFPTELLFVCSQCLTKLDLSHNALGPVLAPFVDDSNNNHSNPIWRLESLLELDLSHNKLVVIGQLGYRCPMLEKLDVSHNALEQFEGVPVPGALRSLRSVQLQHNCLAALFTALPAAGMNRAPLQTVAACFPAAVSVDLSHNLLRFGEQFHLLPSSLVVLNLKQNKLASIGDNGGGGGRTSQPLGGGAPLPQLRELYLGNNQLTVLEDSFLSSATKLELLDVSNNQLSTLNFLLPCQSSLARCDVQNNNISQLPPQLGLFAKLTSLVLDGNPLRSIRRDLLEKGTVALMKFLKERLPPELQGGGAAGVLRQDVSVQQAQEASEAIAQLQADPRQRCVPQYAGGAKPDDRPFATAYNTKGSAAAAPEAVQQLDRQCVRIGERSGTTWDISHRGGTTSAGGGSGLQPATASRNSSGGGGATAFLLPAVLDHRLNCSELHSSSDATFRHNVSIVRCARQVNVEVVSLDFIFAFPSLKELYWTGCRRLAAFRREDHNQHATATPPIAILDLSQCGFGSDVASLSISDAEKQALLLQREQEQQQSSSVSTSFVIGLGRLLYRLSSTLTRLDLSQNPSLDQLPLELGQCVSLKYLLLSDCRLLGTGQQQQGGPHHELAMWQVLSSLRGLLELHLSRCNLTSFPSDEMVSAVGFAKQCWPQLRVLDLSFNALPTVPYSLGLCTQLQSLNLEGNCIKWLRLAILQKGTLAVLEYLRSRLPAASS